MQWRVFPAIFDKPTKIRFATQEEHEYIDLFLRRHWITNVPWILTAIFGSLVPPLVFYIDGLLGTGIILATTPQIVLGSVVLWYLLITAFVIEKFLFWYFNVYILTNQHLVDVNFFSLLARETTEVQLSDIQTITPSIKGIAAQFFNYGDVLVETAAERRVVLFDDVPRPDFVADRIQDLSEGRHK